jgi:predicted metalloprotease with PDZ domain
VRWRPRARRLAGAALLAAEAILACRPAAAQAPGDSLIYDIAIVPTPAHLEVEARLTVGEDGVIELMAPPAAGPAGTDVEGLLATDDRGAPLRLVRGARKYLVTARRGAVRFRYRLGFATAVAMGSTGAGLDSAHLYAVGRSVFVAPDPTAYLKTSRPYPMVRVHVNPPRHWRVVTGWGADGTQFAPVSGEALLGATIAAAPDFRVYRDTAAGTRFLLAIRGRRHFTDSALVAVIAASLTAAAATLGPVPVASVTYTSDLGWKGRTSGSLQGTSSIGLIWEPGDMLERDRRQDVFHETLHLWFGGAMETDRWWTEGVTDYYAARLFASWTGRPAELADFCYESLEHYRQIGHDTTVTMAQEERRGFVGDNTALLVYRKGMLAGLLLDAAIRRGSDGRASLDAVARQALAVADARRTHAVRGSELRDLAVRAGGNGVGAVWDRVVTGTALISEADVARALRVVAGVEVAAPAMRAKERKVLRRHP